jgi:hypothetical protein
MRIGPLARAARELDDATKAKILVAVKEALAAFTKGGRITPPVACWLVAAKA